MAKYQRNAYIRGTGKHVPPGRNSVTVAVDTSGFQDLMAQLAGSASEGVRPAAQAGTQVLYDQVLQNVNAIGMKTGNLRSAIYQVYSKVNSTKGAKATYHVSWNARKAPHGHLVEFGHIMRYRTFIATTGKRKGQWVTDKRHPINPRHVAARPFIRPAIIAKTEAVRAAVEAEIIRRITEATS